MAESLESRWSVLVKGTSMTEEGRAGRVLGRFCAFRGRAQTRKKERNCEFKESFIGSGEWRKLITESCGALRLDANTQVLILVLVYADDGRRNRLVYCADYSWMMYSTYMMLFNFDRCQGFGC